ncbi:MAG: SufE family protein [Candidatus Competibacteraceae bacterium]|nr:SufE family protein [Candidatus Competibacteraceae bacterium]
MNDVQTPQEDIQAAQDKIIRAFQFFEDWMERYQYLIDLGRKLPPFPEEAKTDDNRLWGCQSLVWFIFQQRDERLHFQAVSDSAIVSGLIALLLKVYSGRTPREIVDTPPKFIDEIGLTEHLSPNRNNGLYAMLEAIHSHAHAMVGEEAGR